MQILFGFGHLRQRLLDFRAAATQSMIFIMMIWFRPGGLQSFLYPHHSLTSCLCRTTMRVPCQTEENLQQCLAQRPTRSSGAEMRPLNSPQICRRAPRRMGFLQPKSIMTPQIDTYISLTFPPSFLYCGVRSSAKFMLAVFLSEQADLSCTVCA